MWQRLNQFLMQIFLKAKPVGALDNIGERALNLVSSEASLARGELTKPLAHRAALKPLTSTHSLPLWR